MTVGGGSTGPGSKNPVKIIANIFISFIGAGVLGLPFAFKEVNTPLIIYFVLVCSIHEALIISLDS